MELVLRTVFAYLFILFVLRVTTRRFMRSATPLDFMVIFLFGGLAMPSVLVGDMSLTAAVLGMSTVAAMHFGLSRLRVIWPWVGMATEGTSVLLYAGRQFDEDQLRKSRVSKQDVESEMRARGLRDLWQVEAVTVEHNGAINVIPSRKRRARTTRSAFKARRLRSVKAHRPAE